jgi:hypothetical protein
VSLQWDERVMSIEHFSEEETVLRSANMQTFTQAEDITLNALHCQLLRSVFRSPLRKEDCTAFSCNFDHELYLCSI